MGGCEGSRRGDQARRADSLRRVERAHAPRPHASDPAVLSRPSKRRGGRAHASAAGADLQRSRARTSPTRVTRCCRRTARRVCSTPRARCSVSRSATCCCMGATSPAPPGRTTPCRLGSPQLPTTRSTAASPTSSARACLPPRSRSVTTRRPAAPAWLHRPPALIDDARRVRGGPHGRRVVGRRHAAPGRRARYADHVGGARARVGGNG